MPIFVPVTGFGPILAILTSFYIISTELCRSYRGLVGKKKEKEAYKTSKSVMIDHEG